MSNWRKSSLSFANGNCVEVSDDGDTVSVRDTADVRGPSVQFTSEQWREFAAGIKAIPGGTLPL